MIVVSEGVKGRDKNVLGILFPKIFGNLSELVKIALFAFKRMAEIDKLFSFGRILCRVSFP